MSRCLLTLVLMPMLLVACDLPIVGPAKTTEAAVPN